MAEARVIWRPQPKQRAFMERPEYEALYGGAAGGGKSDALLCEALRQVHIPHYRGLILRKTYPELSELVDRSRELYPGAFPQAKYVGTEHVWLFPSGAKIYFGAMQYESDRTKYQGKRYDFIAFDELTHFTWNEYAYMFSRNRPSGPGTRVYIRAATNPGGIGHGWVKERFVTPAPPMTPMVEEVVVQGRDGPRRMRRTRIFVPSTVFDNQELLRNAPEYLANLAMLPENERMALLYGSWDSFDGQVFREWRNDPAHYGDQRWTPYRRTGGSTGGLTSGMRGPLRWGGSRWTRTDGCTTSRNSTAARVRPTRACGCIRGRLRHRSGGWKARTPCCGASGLRA